MRSIAAALLVFVLLLAQSACSRAPATPTSPTPNPRLVVLSPALAATLKDLGLADRVVGRHAWDLALDEKIPVCGDQAGIDYETLLSVQPTHVLIEWGTRPLPPRLDELAAERSWQVRKFTMLSLDEIRATTQRLADEFAAGKPSGASRVIAEMDRAWSKRADSFAGCGKVLLLHSTSPPAVLGPGSFHHQILERIGAVPAITKGAPYMELDTEDILKLAPDSIVLVMARPRTTPPRAVAPTPDELKTILGPLARPEIPAVANGRIALIDDPLCELPSTSMVKFAADLAAILTRWSQRK